MNGPDFVGRVGDLDNLVAFFPGVVQPHRDDIQDILLFAQLRASHLYDFQAQWHKWIHNYRVHLEQQGFEPRSIVVGDSLLISSLQDLEQARFRIVSPHLRPRLAGLMRDAFAGLGIERFVERFLQGEVPSANLGSFQVMPCDMDDAGELTTLLCSLRLNVDGHAAGQPRLILHFKGGAYRFNRARYAFRRKAVQDYLAGKARAVISRFEL